MLHSGCTARMHAGKWQSAVQLLFQQKVYNFCDTIFSVLPTFVSFVDGVGLKPEKRVLMYNGRHHKMACFTESQYVFLTLASYLSRPNQREQILILKKRKN